MNLNFWYPYFFDIEVNPGDTYLCSVCGHSHDKYDGDYCDRGMPYDAESNPRKYVCSDVCAEDYIASHFRPRHLEYLLRELGVLGKMVVDVRDGITGDVSGSTTGNKKHLSRMGGVCFQAAELKEAMEDFWKHYKGGNDV